MKYFEIKIRCLKMPHWSDLRSHRKWAPNDLIDGCVMHFVALFLMFGWFFGYFFLKFPEIWRFSGLEMRKSPKIEFFSLNPEVQGLAIPQNPFKNSQITIFLPQTCTNAPEMHPTTNFISGKYRPKCSESAQNRKNHQKSPKLDFFFTKSTDSRPGNTSKSL